MNDKKIKDFNQNIKDLDEKITGLKAKLEDILDEIEIANNGNKKNLISLNIWSFYILINVYFSSWNYSNNHGRRKYGKLLLKA